MRQPIEVRVGPSYIVEVFESELFEMAFGIREEEITTYCATASGYVAMRTDCATTVAEYRERKLTELAASPREQAIAECARAAMECLNRERKSA